MRENKKKFRNKINFFVFVSPRLTKIHLDVSFVRFKQIYWHTQFFFFFSFNFLKCLRYLRIWLYKDWGIGHSFYSAITGFVLFLP
jgi:hypothetical protein